MIEFSGSNTAHISIVISQHEWFSYVFDSTPMFLALIIFHAFHPGTVLIGPDAEFVKLTKEEKRAGKEAKKQVKAEARRLKKEQRKGAQSTVNDIELAGSLSSSSQEIR